MSLVLDKVCSKCHQHYPGTMFGKHSATADGLDSWCRNCKREDNKSRQRRRAKPVTVKAGFAPMSNKRAVRTHAIWREAATRHPEAFDMGDKS